METKGLRIFLSRVRRREVETPRLAHSLLARRRRRGENVRAAQL